MEKQSKTAPLNGRAPDPEVSARPKRRTFTAEYKMRILEEVDASKGEPGAVGAILRREGLYSSHLAEWRKDRRQASLAGMSTKRGRKPTRNPLSDEVQRLRRENEKLRSRLAQAEVIIDVQKKISSILGIPLRTTEDDENGS